MNRFRLLTKHPIALIDAPAGLESRLAREGYEVLSRPAPASSLGFFLLAFRLRLKGRRWHLLLAGRLAPREERIWRLFLRTFPFLIASLTRIDDPRAISLDERLKKLAERDYKEHANEGRNHHATPIVNQRSSARARTEFDHLLETPHP